MYSDVRRGELSFCAVFSKMPNRVVNFIITVFRLYSRKNCGTTAKYQQARVFFLYNISICTGLFCTADSEPPIEQCTVDV